MEHKHLTDDEIQDFLDGNIPRGETDLRHHLERCEICGRYYATTRFLEHIKELESDHPDEKEQHHHCPTCAKLYSRRNLRITAPHLAKTYGGEPVK